jgi:methionyl-tRNA formyltransferase
MRLVMMGTGQFAEPTFEALLRSPYSVVGLVTQPDRAVGAERGSTRQTGRGMKAMALEHGLPVLQPEKINTPEGVGALAEWKPDLLVVAAYGQILSRDVLAVPALGGINVHASLLPKYRGAAPIAWAIYHGEKTTGVTIIKMTTGLDAGDILAQEAVELGSTETAGEAEARLAQVGARLAVQVAGQIATGTANGRKQDPALVTKAPKLSKEHGAIDWSRHARQVCNHVRAMQPWPTAYTYLHRPGKPTLRVIVTKAAPFSLLTDPGGPGDVLVLQDKDRPVLAVIVGGGHEMVRIEELQPAGKRLMSAEEFLRGHRPQKGDRFGPEPA